MSGELWGFTEVAEFLGLSRQRVTALTNRPDFPEPVAHLAATRVWLAEDVREWERKRRELYPGHVEDEGES